MIKSGDFRFHRIDIQNRVNTKDSDGNDIVEYETVAYDVPAAMKPISVNTFIASQASQSEIRGRFVIRYQPGLEATDRVLEDGKVYDIHGWLPDPEFGREYLSAPYSEGVNDGGF